MKLPFKFLVVEVIFTLVATFLYFVAFITILAGYSWCGGVHTCDARVAAGVGIISRPPHHVYIYDSVTSSDDMTKGNGHLIRLGPVKTFAEAN